MAGMNLSTGERLVGLAHLRQSIADILPRDEDMASIILQFKFRDIRPKAASEISNLHDASKLLEHGDKQITKKVYRRIGETVKPTR
ncbi:hypothetical protein UNDKW_2271 [Undibacterium sp. KW1]|uniref:hypothetical protein n=1 Tax=Undibacterium sp. KW1 TaxID=2058624 RepID=UPI001331C5D6|nr:hypothetical protein [Undibacterium sp. KW1]BBB60544.1 hypothetical protein UNDKW_2271 [Undibacterium sp. KW1]